MSRRLLTMAYDRRTFKDRVLEKLSGALGHHYMAALAELNRQTEWVQHWRGEIERLVFIELGLVLESPIKGNWNRQRAVNEVIEELRAVDPNFRRRAENVAKRYYGLKKIARALPAGVDTEFYNMVNEAVAEALQPRPDEDE